MTDSPSAALILGGSGRSGSLVAAHLADHGFRDRTASRHGSDRFFDWEDPTTYTDALAILGRPPTSFQRFAEQNAAAWTNKEHQ
jgi:uncharacterized protein YbjT (DUF2867 family)